MFLKVLILSIILTIKFNLIESVYCYVCNESQIGCGSMIDLTRAQNYLEPCSGQCVSYVNPNTGLLTRTCSWYIGIMESQNGVQTLNGVTYSFCDSNGCNTNSNTNTATSTQSQQGACLSCKNGGSMGNDCKCNCLPFYSGQYCEIVDCFSQYSFCATDYTSSDCSKEVIRLMCPRLCNPNCISTSTATTTTTTKPTTTPCTIQACANQGFFDINTCSCKCISTATTGKYCEFIDCMIPDDPLCSSIDCNAFPAAKFICIQKCKTCQLK